MKNGLLNHVYASARKTSNQDLFFKTLSESSKQTVCKSYAFGYLISEVKNKIMLDIKPDINALSTKNLYDLMWTVVFAQELTPLSKKYLQELL